MIFPTLGITGSYIQSLYDSLEITEVDTEDNDDKWRLERFDTS